MSFFSQLPPEPIQPEPERREIPRWLQAPRDEIPFAVAVVRCLARVPGAALHLRRLDVYREGVHFELQLDVRREADLDDARADLVDGFLIPRGHRHGADRQFRLGVTLPDGTSSATTDAADWRFSTIDNDQPPAGPRLSLAGGGGSGDTHQWTQRISAWLWPLPEDGPLTLHFSSDALGIAEGSIIIDIAAEDWRAGVVGVWDS
ncbi:hypothetical protein [Clavibacter sp. km1a]|uniref:hypothetical protein n=1 Tax=Clavibacter sp. km1a TaxID=3459136 RepID=UPI004041D9F8